MRGRHCQQPRVLFAFFAALALLCLTPVASRAQPTDPPPAAPAGSQPADPPPDNAAPTNPPPPVTAESVKNAITALDAQTTLEEAVRKASLDAYNEALANIQRRDDAARRLADFQRLTAEAPALLESIRTELAAPPTDVKPQVPENATVQQMEQGLAQAQAELTAARQQADDLQAEATRRSERRPAINDQLSQSRKQLAELDEALRTFAASESPILTDARRASLQSRRDALAKEIEALEAEAASYEARRDLLPARRDRALRRVNTAQKLVDQWQKLVSDRRQIEAEQALRQAERLRREAASQDPVLRVFAEQTEQLASERLGQTGTAQQLAQLADQLRNTQLELTRLREGYQSIQRRIQATDLNRATGLLLRRQYEQLPSAADLRRQFRAVTKSLEEAEINWIERDEQRVGAGDINRVVEDLISQIEERTDGPIENRADVEAVARELATNRRDVLGQLVDDASNRFQTLLALSDSSKELLDSVEAYQSYIEERILWIRSIATDRVPTVQEIIDDLAWLTNPTAWGDAVSAVWYDTAKNPVLVAGGVLCVILLFLLGRVARVRLRALPQRVGSYRTDSFALTALGVVYTLIAAAFVPGLLFFIGWLLLRPAQQVEVAVAFGTAFEDSSAMAFVLLWSWYAVSPKGIFEAHFRWPMASLRSIRAHLRWFIPSALSVAILAAAIERQSGDELAATLGRTAFTAHMLLLALLSQRLLRPGGPSMGEYHKRHEGTILNRARYAIYILAIGLPVALAVVSWLGYHYTALQLFSRVQLSIFFVVALILIYSLLQRWLFIARRKVAIDDARRRREQATPEPKPAGERTAPLEEERFDLPAISAQTQQLFRVSMFVSAILGFYAIWASTLPALRMLERVQIWPQVHIVQSEADSGVDILNARPAAAPATSPAASPPADQAAASTSNGNASPTPTLPLTPAATLPEGGTTQPEPELVVSLADLGLSLLVLAATIIAFRNIPGLVEIVVLQRLPLDAGSRYALSTVLRYLIAIIGVTIAFNAVGISWNKVQWLAAALTFGLAFGLQEIFANFVSGLIILAERPIRVGDTITVGGVSGNVTRIRMRATTILDWDRKELIIPNKSFITDQVINWTLTDPVLRVIIPVGVSYDSDVDQVESLLLRVASQNALVLRDPKPQAWFLGFGDSTLNFELRVFIPSIDHLLSIKHQMHNAIIKAFRDANIEIAFPQRDLHIRTSDADFRFVRGDNRTVDAEPPEEAN